MISFEEAVEIVSRRLGYSAELATVALLEAMKGGAIHTTTSSSTSIGANELVITTGLSPIREQPIRRADLVKFITKQETLSVQVGTGATQHKLKTRRYELDAEIESAKKKASDPDDYHSVWIALKELAISGMPPFTGFADDKTLGYTTSKNELASFTKGALRKRLNPNAR